MPYCKSEGSPPASRIGRNSITPPSPTTEMDLALAKAQMTVARPLEGEVLVQATCSIPLVKVLGLHEHNEAGLQGRLSLE